MHIKTARNIYIPIRTANMPGWNVYLYRTHIHPWPPRHSGMQLYFHIFLCHPKSIFRQVLKQNQKQKLANDRSGTLSFIFPHIFPFQVHRTDMQSQIFHLRCHIQHEYPKVFELLKRCLISAVFVLFSQYCWECHQIPLKCFAVVLTLYLARLYIIQIASYILFGMFCR